MLKKVNAKFEPRIYSDFNCEKEEMAVIFHEGCQQFKTDVCSVETMSGASVTKRGNYVGYTFGDLFKGSLNGFGMGMFIEAKGNILVNGKVLAESFRKKCDKNDFAIIEGKNETMAFYPIFEDGFAMYMDYDANTNKIGYISVKENAEAEMRNMIKFGCCFSKDGEYVFEDADVNAFAVCGIARIMH